MFENEIVLAETKNKSSVGLKIENNNFKFVFPPKYFDINKKPNSFKDCTDDIFKLMELIDKYGSNELNTANEETKSELPIYSMLWLVNDYLQHGFYKEVEISQKILNTGRINWKKTLKMCKPFFDDKGNVFYNNFVTTHVHLSENEILLEIQEYCVKKSMNIVGWYFQLPYNEFEDKDKDIVLFYIDFLKGLLQTTFLDYKKELIVNMLAILNKKCENDSCFNTNEIFTNKFETVFENLIIDVFSISKNQLKLFYPYSKWFDKNGNSKKMSNLRPDAILPHNQNIYILDAKYYGYGYGDEESDGSLPDTSSVHKQITYAEFLKSNYNKIKQKFSGNEILPDKENLNIYNIFVLPTHKNFFTDNAVLDYVGHYKPEWDIAINSTFSTIYTFVIDLKTLVDASFDIDLKQKLKQEFLKNVSAHLN